MSWKQAPNTTPAYRTPQFITYVPHVSELYAQFRVGDEQFDTFNGQHLSLALANVLATMPNGISRVEQYNRLRDRASLLDMGAMLIGLAVGFHAWNKYTLAVAMAMSGSFLIGVSLLVQRDAGRTFEALIRDYNAFVREQSSRVKPDRVSPCTAAA